MAEGGRKRVFYFSFEELYDASQNPQGEAGDLAIELMKYYGFRPILAFTIATDAPRDASPVIFHVGNEQHPWMKRLMELLDEEEYDYHEAVEKLFNELNINAIAVIVYDGYDTGIAIGFPMT
jgi:hypothetical protein